MRGVVFLGDRELELRQFPDPTPGPGEVVVEIKASGMCGSDLKFYRAPREGGSGAGALGIGGDGGPVIAGHEPCGVVAAVGPGVDEAQARVGRRVMVHHYHGCGHCEHCSIGWSQLCREGMVVYGVTADGGHAPYLKVPASTLVALPESLSFETGAAISCGTGTAYGALARLELSGRDTIAVFGQGPVGLSATQLARAMGARVVALDVIAERRKLAEDFGAEAVIDPQADDPVDALLALTRGRGVDLALDCSGVPQARLAAVRGTRTWGTVCFVGEGDTVTLDVSRDLLRKQLTIVGSWTFSRSGQAECARFVAERGIEVERLFSHRFTLDQAGEAYRLFDTQTTGKGVFVF
jgi:2-desacetyl-2-hydroxyethyl bacteriochlorophyllide A dehydrogenase